MQIESDKTILHQEQITICGYDVRYEIWAWKGCWAKAIIFENDDISDITDQEVENLLKTLELIKDDSDMAFYRLEDFTFVIFDFQVATKIEFEPEKA